MNKHIKQFGFHRLRDKLQPDEAGWTLTLSLQHLEGGLGPSSGLPLGFSQQLPLLLQTLLPFLLLLLLLLLALLLQTLLMGQSRGSKVTAETAG